jgi:hypothetical protein
MNNPGPVRMLALVMLGSACFHLVVFGLGYLVGRSHEPDPQTPFPATEPETPQSPGGDGATQRYYATPEH